MAYVTKFVNLLKLHFDMNALYIHGLDSFLKPEKKSVLQNAGLNVTALHLNYREKLGVYETLKEAAIHKKADLIIGYQLGGYLASVLADDLGLPCLLFNPAMQYTDVFYSKVPVIEEPRCPSRYVVLGCKDETQNPMLIRNNFEMKQGDSDLRIISCQWLGNSIDLKTFDEMVNWALYNLKRKN